MFQLAQKHLAPIAGEIDRNDSFPGFSVSSKSSHSVVVHLLMNKYYVAGVAEMVSVGESSDKTARTTTC